MHEIDKLVAELTSTIENDFTSSHYRFSNGHFEIGKNLHSDTYYFVRKYLQEYDNCKKLSILLEDLLHKKFGSDTELTLVGYGNHVGMLLSMVTKRNSHINYEIIEKQGSSFAFKNDFKSAAKEIVIILPASCTHNTSFKIRKFLSDQKRKLNNTEFDYRINFFISIFLVIDGRLQLTEEERDVDTLPNSREVNIYKNYGWLRLNNTVVKLGANATAYSLVRLKARLSLPENCSSCFPGCSREEEPKEKYLFSIHEQYESPMLIMGIPRFGGSVDDTNRFSTIMQPSQKKKSAHLYGNIAVNDTIFNSYLQGNVFYENNREDILEFFDNKLSGLLHDAHEILIIVSDTKQSSNFPEEIVLRKCFENKLVRILRYMPSNEFVDNFISLYSHLLHNNATIIFFEDVLSGGKAFRLISDYITHSSENSNTRTRGFDLLLTLVDRTTYYAKNETLTRLDPGYAKNALIPFFKLNLPTGAGVHLGDPFKRNYANLKKILSECHLDALRTIVASEILSSSPESLHEASVNADQKSERELFLPLASNNEKQTLFYARLFTKKNYDYFRLYLTHQVVGLLSTPGYVSKDTDIIQKLFGEVYLFEEFILDNDKHDPLLRNKKFERQVIENMIFRLLTQPPFIYYESIYTSVFNYSIKALEQQVGKIRSSYEFIRLKTLIKSSVELNSNFIISEKFLGVVKRDFEGKRLDFYLQRYSREFAEIKDRTPFADVVKRKLQYKYKQLVSYNYFMLYCYKILTSRNPSRSIRLEGILSSPEFMPSGLKEEAGDMMDSTDKMRNFFHNPYYLFHRILKAENIYFLNELKEYHRLQYRSHQFYQPDPRESLFTHIARKGIAPLRKAYFTKKSDPVIRNAQMLIDASGAGRKEKETTISGRKENSESHIHTAVCNMLKTASLIEEGKKASRADTDEKYRSNIDSNIRTILDSVLSIVQPEDKNAKLGYAFFIEYAEADKNENNLYPVLSSNHLKKDNPLTLRLHPDGLIRSALRGLADTSDCTNPQTFLFAGKTSDGSVISFQDHYYSMPHSWQPGKPESKKNTSYFLREENHRRVNFQAMFDKDHLNNQTKEGLKCMEDVNMCLVFRLSNILEQDDYALRGKAVLVITSNGLRTKKAFTDFMNVDKIRLLLLIKEDLLAYIENLFGNNFFIELLQNRQKEIAVTKLDHGVQNYILMQYRILKKIESGKHPEKHDDYYLLLKIIVKAIEGQHSFRTQSIKSMQISDEQIPYTAEDIVKRFKLIFESEDFDGQVAFETVALFYIENVTIFMNDYVFDVVIPEIIHNMKKYSSDLKPNRFSISYIAGEKKLIFSNNMKEEISEIKIQKDFGGISMCSDIMESFNYPPISATIDQNSNQFNTVITLTSAS